MNDIKFINTVNSFFGKRIILNQTRRTISKCKIWGEKTHCCWVSLNVIDKTVKICDFDSYVFKGSKDRNCDWVEYTFETELKNYKSWSVYKISYGNKDMYFGINDDGSNKIFTEAEVDVIYSLQVAKKMANAV